MKRWKWALLIFELVLFALILVLPQVALPDFTFHGGTAPVVLKARFSAPPPVVTVAAVTPIVQSRLANTWSASGEDSSPTAQRTPHSRLSLLCVLIC